jgi:hypothetical protein
MPASRKRADRTVRAAKSSAVKPSAKTPAAMKLSSVALDMEEPLREASAAAHALCLMGFGLEGQGHSNEGRAILDVASTACQRLNTLDDVWRRLCEIALSRQREGGARLYARSAGVPCRSSVDPE